MYRGRLANVSEMGRSRWPGPRTCSTGGMPDRSPPPPVPPGEDPKNEVVLIPGAVVRNALKVKVRTVGSRADLAAARFTPPRPTPLAATATGR